MYENTSINPIKYVVIGLLILGIFASLILLPILGTKAQSQQTSTGTTTPHFSDALAANTLCSAGLGAKDCATKTTQTTTSSTQTSGGLFSGLFGGSSAGAQYHPSISILNVEGQTEVYRIINGQKHSLPTTEIFYSYDLTTKMIQKVSAEELEKYPTARLFMVEADEDEENITIYYLTQGGMLRPILNDKVFYSYGDRKEDVITINQKEFNYYPRNQFIYLERPQMNRDIYQITGGLKRYLTPVAVKRLNLSEGEIAPVNQMEFDAYPEGEPVIF